MLIKEINESLDVNDLFVKLTEEFENDLQVLSEVNINADGSVEWEAPTAAEKDQFSKDKMVPQHGSDAVTNAKIKNMIDKMAIPGDFVMFPNDKAVGIIASLDHDKGVVTVINREKKPIGTFNIKDLRLTGKSTTTYKTVYTAFKGQIKNPIAPEDAQVKRFLLNNEVH